MLALVVTNAFGDYRRGDWITDPDQVDEIRGSDQDVNVVAVTVPDAAPAPAPAKAS